MYLVYNCLQNDKKGAQSIWSLELVHEKNFCFKKYYKRDFKRNFVSFTFCYTQVENFCNSLYKDFCLRNKVEQIFYIK